MNTRALLKPIKKLLRPARLYWEDPVLFRAHRQGMNLAFVRDFLLLRDKLGITPASIWDVGAFEGEWCRAARCVFPEAEIHAFEPIPDCFRKLQSALPAQRFTAHNLALSERTGTASFFLNEFNASSSLHAMTSRHVEEFPMTERQREISVKTARLDEVLPASAARAPVFCKLDVHGADLEVLRGFGDRLKDVKVLEIEILFDEFYANSPRPAEIISFLFAQGFTAFYQTGVHFSDRTEGRILFCDLFFVRQ